MAVADYSAFSSPGNCGKSSRPDSDDRAHRVLVVDDEAAFRDVVVRFLSKRGFHCYQAADASSAMRLLHKHPTVEVVITDLSMPGASGLDLVESIRAQIDRKLVLVVVTGDGGEADFARSRELGVHEFFRKPVDLKKLVAVVEGLD